MKSNPKIIDCLNGLLADELAAVNQYMVEAEMCGNWGLTKLADMEEKRAITEMKHAEALIARILFLEGQPIVSELRRMSIGAEVPQMFEGDHGLEMGAVKSYNAAVALAVKVGDNASRELLEGILKDEDRHIDGIEANLDQIGQMGVQNYLAVQIED